MTTKSLTNRVLVAPDSFKGTYSAVEVAGAIAAGVRAAGTEAEELPIGDGGEGTMDALVSGLGGELRSAMASDPLGRDVGVHFALQPDQDVAIVEMAQASGLSRLEEAERDAWRASTRGTGELIAAAVRAGAHEVIVTVGGSATTDGGAGALAALEHAGVSPRLRVVCDVRTPWEDASRVFGPQKGADPKTVKRLERRLDELAERAPRDPRGVPMTGCAGGLSGGLWAFRNAELLPGAAFVLDALGFDERARHASFVVTGEGALDAQTLAGKAVAEVSERCSRFGIACHAIVGQDALRAPDLLGLASVIEASTLEEFTAAGRALVA